MKVIVLFLLICGFNHANAGESYQYLNINFLNGDAVCNDGTPAGYYFASGDPDKWHIHFQGGGWCYDNSSCAQRMQLDPFLMSSAPWQPSMMISGIFDTDPENNPDFYNATHVYIPYCSSDMHSGNRTASSESFGWYFMGKEIVRQTIETLLSSGLENATKVLVSGCSDGGGAVFANVDYIASLLPPSSERVYKGHPDAGYFLNYPALSPSDNNMPDQLALGPYLWGGVPDEDCVASMSNSDMWLCYLGQYAINYIQTPLLIQQMNEDFVQVFIDGIYPPLTAEMSAYLVDFRANMSATFYKNVHPPHSIFSTACYGHCITENHWFWTVTATDGMNDRTALSKFYFGGVSDIWYDNCEGFNCSTVCPPAPQL